MASIFILKYTNNQLQVNQEAKVAYHLPVPRWPKFIPEQCTYLKYTISKFIQLIAKIKELSSRLIQQLTKLNN